MNSPKNELPSSYAHVHLEINKTQNITLFLLYTDITKTCPCNILQFFTAVKKDNFQMKNCDVFLIFAQNIDSGYTLEPPQ